MYRALYLGRSVIGWSGVHVVVAPFPLRYSSHMRSNREMISMLAVFCLTARRDAKEAVDMAEKIVAEVFRRYPDDKDDVTDLQPHS